MNFHKVKVRSKIAGQEIEHCQYPRVLSFPYSQAKGVKTLWRRSQGRLKVSYRENGVWLGEKAGPA